MYLVEKNGNILGRSGPVLGNLFVFTTPDKAKPHMDKGCDLLPMELEEIKKIFGRRVDFFETDPKVK